MRWAIGEAYPAARERCRGAAPLVAGQYGAVETTGGFVTLGDTLADVMTFSGRPDSVSISVETFDAVIAFRERGRSAVDSFVVRAGQTLAPDVAVEIVQARNNVAGSNATVQVIGKWLRAAAPPRTEAARG